jgi:hypothetical protein
MSGLEEFVSEHAAAELRRQLAQERRRTKQLEEDIARLRRHLGILERVAAASPRPPRWLARRSSGGNHATPCLLVTDTHFDEVVRADEVGGVNAYDRRIAELRLESAFAGAVRVAKDYIGGFTWDGAVVLLGGDLISGDIHEELVATNEGTVVETVLYWTEPLAAGIRLLAEEFGRVHVVSVPGNHGRRSRRPRYKRRAQDNFDWLLSWSVQRTLASDDRITWHIPSALHAEVQVYSTHIRLEHGDEARGGTGISAALAPLALLQHRRLKQAQAMSRPLDLLVLGHWHRRHVLPGLILGGTLKGPDEYTLGRGYDAEPASQELFVVSPEHGVVINAPVFVADRKREGW